jgi:hypothetical protein
MSEEEQIEEILMEASAWGMRQEIIDSAHKYMRENPNMKLVNAFEWAYNEWMK